MLTDGAALNRWRLILGKNADQQIGLSDGQLVRMDEALDFLYGREAGADVKGERDPQGGHGASQLTVARWLSEVRCLFPRETAEILQRHALDRYQLTELLANREVLEKMEPNQALLETILSLKHLMKGPVLDAARCVVKRVVDQLTEQMKSDVQRSALGKLDRSSRSSVRSLRNLDIQRTIRENLPHYDRDARRLMLEKVYFNGRIKRCHPWRVILAVDESGSMMPSIIHSAVMAGIFAKLPVLDTRLVIFDTSVVDLSGYVDDPVEALMSIQLGGGTDIAGALRYCESLITSPHRTMVVKNPIMHQFAISLIWGIYENDRLQTTFRYMEDGSFNTVDEEEFCLPADARIGLVHPVELEPQVLSAWQQQLKDYEITQSILQLNRPVYRLEPGGEKRRALEDFGGKMLNGLSLSGKLQSLGWFRGSVQDGGGYYTFYREDPALGLGVELRFSGCFIGDENETVTVYDAVFYKAGTVKRGSYYYDTPKAEHIFALGDIPARYYSEVFYQLERATASSTETDPTWRERKN